MTEAARRLLRLRLLLAVLGFVSYAALGAAVSRRSPGSLDRAAEALAGHGLRAATFLTDAGLFPVYATLCVLLIGVAIARRAWRRQIVISIVTLVVGWRLSDTAKALFARPRPAAWFVHHETSFSYASGHATLALTFYGFWAYLAWRASLPVAARRTIVALPALWIVAIGWSRLALGAHYATDVIGGYLLGAALLGLAILALDAPAVGPVTTSNVIEKEYPS
jgi:membrane-associated phospholipid phosphatase